MQWQRNSGADKCDVIHNQFTAYVKRAVQNKRLRYIMAQCSYAQMMIDFTNNEICQFDPAADFQEILEVEAMQQALRSIKDKERQIVLARVVDEKSFGRIAEEMGMSYKAVTSLFYRVMKKLRLYLEGGESE